MARQMQKSTTTVDNTDEIVEKKTTKKTYKDGDYILCRSIIAGGLTINCRSGESYRFNNYGSTCEIEHRDLVELIRKRSDHIFIPRIIIEEDEFVDTFPQLKKFYSELYTVGDLKEILSLPDSQMEKAINSLPNELRATLKNLAATMIETGEIDSISKVRTLTDVLDADFNFISELFTRR